jgi:hypothetical protein
MTLATLDNEHLAAWMPSNKIVAQYIDSKAVGIIYFSALTSCRVSQCQKTQVALTPLQTSTEHTSLGVLQFSGSNSVRQVVAEGETIDGLDGGQAEGGLGTAARTGGGN